MKGGGGGGPFFYCKKIPKNTNKIIINIGLHHLHHHQYDHQQLVTIVILITIIFRRHLCKVDDVNDCHRDPDVDWYVNIVDLVKTKWGDLLVVIVLWNTFHLLDDWY